MVLVTHRYTPKSNNSGVPSFTWLCKSDNCIQSPLKALLLLNIGIMMLSKKDKKPKINKAIEMNLMRRMAGSWKKI